MNNHIDQIRFTILLMLISITPCWNQPGSNHVLKNEPIAKTQIKLQLITNQIQSPVALGVPGDGSNRLFICQKEGKVWIIEKGKVINHPFLDVSNQMVRVDPGYDERGLLGIAFHPDFKINHKFYVYYSAPSNTRGSDHKGVVAEYKVSAKSSDIADILTKRILLEVEEPESNHNGGNLAFGPDGYLYICLGDGGGGGDRHGTIGNGQNLATLLGKIIRIGVNGQPYAIPKDNPFVTRKDARPEIWAYGLRNPWRFSFDRVTKQLFAGDVGQDKYEEVDIITKGGNYGWRIKEGLHDFKVPARATKSNLIDPIYEYDHGKGVSITGGYIYRGKAIPGLQGKYVYGDYNGSMWLLTKTGNKWVNSDLEVGNKPNENMQILSWGQDEAEELYMLVSFSSSSGGKGAVYKVVKE
ncbi:MAG: PQQ-dependent sugar dehydrogenase [Ginsengibacter sp.]